GRRHAASRLNVDEGGDEQLTPGAGDERRRLQPVLPAAEVRDVLEHDDGGAVGRQVHGLHAGRSLEVHEARERVAAEVLHGYLDPALGVGGEVAAGLSLRQAPILRAVAADGEDVRSEQRAPVLVRAGECQRRRLRVPGQAANGVDAQHVVLVGSPEEPVAAAVWVYQADLVASARPGGDDVGDRVVHGTGRGSAALRVVVFLVPTIVAGRGLAARR